MYNIREEYRVIDGKAHRVTIDNAGEVISRGYSDAENGLTPTDKQFENSSFVKGYRYCKSGKRLSKTREAKENPSFKEGYEFAKAGGELTNEILGDKYYVDGYWTYRNRNKSYNRSR